MDIRKYFKVHTVTNKKLLNTPLNNGDTPLNNGDTPLNNGDTPLNNGDTEYKVFVDGSAFNNGKKGCKELRYGYFFLTMMKKKIGQ